jgi:PTH1 family peptidyl-tRNA hydrolase
VKYLIAGLGNIGPEYKNTRHNAGFMILDALAGGSGTPFTTRRYGDIAEFRFKGRILTLLKPSTYMNLSGNSVRYWLNKTDTGISNLLVVTDDLALPFGQIRLRKKGSDGGHNGLKNINEVLGNNEYPRLRFGIGGSGPAGNQVNYVLGEWTREELDDLADRLKTAAEAIKYYVINGIDQAMTIYNKPWTARGVDDRRLTIDD